MDNTSNNLNIVKDKFKDLKKYKTTDLPLAAVMIIEKKNLLYIEPDNNLRSKRNGIFKFVFEDDADRESLVLKFTTNSEELKVVPNAMTSTMRYLKDLTKNFGK